MTPAADYQISWLYVGIEAESASPLILRKPLTYDQVSRLSEPIEIDQALYNSGYPDTFLHIVAAQRDFSLKLCVELLDGVHTFIQPDSFEQGDNLALPGTLKLSCSLLVSEKGGLDILLNPRHRGEQFFIEQQEHSPNNNQAFLVLLLERKKQPAMVSFNHQRDAGIRFGGGGFFGFDDEENDRKKFWFPWAAKAGAGLPVLVFFASVNSHILSTSLSSKKKPWLWRHEEYLYVRLFSIDGREQLKRYSPEQAEALLGLHGVDAGAGLSSGLAWYLMGEGEIVVDSHQDVSDGQLQDTLQNIVRLFDCWRQSSTDSPPGILTCGQGGSKSKHRSKDNGGGEASTQSREAQSTPAPGQGRVTANGGKEPPENNRPVNYGRENSGHYLPAEEQVYDFITESDAPQPGLPPPEEGQRVVDGGNNQPSESRYYMMGPDGPVPLPDDNGTTGTGGETQPGDEPPTYDEVDSHETDVFNSAQPVQRAARQSPISYSEVSVQIMQLLSGYFADISVVLNSETIAQDLLGLTDRAFQYLKPLIRQWQKDLLSDQYAGGSMPSETEIRSRFLTNESIIKMIQNCPYRVAIEEKFKQFYRSLWSHFARINSDQLTVQHNVYDPVLIYILSERSTEKNNPTSFTSQGQAFVATLVGLSFLEVYFMADHTSELPTPAVTAMAELLMSQVVNGLVFLKQDAIAKQLANMLSLEAGELKEQLDLFYTLYKENVIRGLLMRGASIYQQFYLNAELKSLQDRVDSFTTRSETEQVTPVYSRVNKPPRLPPESSVNEPDSSPPLPPRPQSMLMETSESAVRDSKVPPPKPPRPPSLLMENNEPVSILSPTLQNAPADRLQAPAFADITSHYEFSDEWRAQWTSAKPAPLARPHSQYGGVLPPAPGANDKEKPPEIPVKKRRARQRSVSVPTFASIGQSTFAQKAGELPAPPIPPKPGAGKASQQPVSVVAVAEQIRQLQGQYFSGTSNSLRSEDIARDLRNLASSIFKHLEPLLRQWQRALFEGTFEESSEQPARLIRQFFVGEKWLNQVQSNLTEKLSDDYRELIKTVFADSGQSFLTEIVETKKVIDPLLVFSLVEVKQSNGPLFFQGKTLAEGLAGSLFLEAYFMDDRSRGIPGSAADNLAISRMTLVQEGLGIRGRHTLKKELSTILTAPRLDQELLENFFLQNKAQVIRSLLIKSTSIHE